MGGGGSIALFEDQVPSGAACYGTLPKAYASVGGVDVDAAEGP